VNTNPDFDLRPTRGCLYAVVVVLGLYLVATAVAAVVWWLLR
jgi:hypothetical protein